MAIQLTQDAVNAAKSLLEHPLINEIFDDMERDAVNAAVNVSALEHELRLVLLMEVKVIRNLRSKLLLLKAREASLAEDSASE